MKKMYGAVAWAAVVVVVACLAAGCGEPAKPKLVLEGDPSPEGEAGGTSGGVATKTQAAWLNWRGPEQNGVSSETGLPAQVAQEGAGKNLLWVYPMAGRGCPVAVDGRLYSWGYKGDGPTLQEWLVCLDSETGREIWSAGVNDFVNDAAYHRFAIGSPTIDGETKNVYWLTTAGLFSCYSADGTLLWQHSMMEEFGRLTFPNGRTGSPVIDGDFVIANGITSNWGTDGPARDRLYGFDKKTGKLAWTSTPGLAPKDSSFCTPTLGQLGNQWVLYYGTGCGNVVCVNARTGKPLWRFPLSGGGVNSSIVLYKNMAIAIHGQENVDASSTGRMVAIRTDVMPVAAAAPAAGAPPAPNETPLLPKTAEAWRNDELCMFTSSPTLVGNRLYQMIDNGDLYCLDADTGKTLWKMKLDKTQTHGSPLYADGKLYVGTDSGQFYILKPGDTGAETLCHVQLEGACLGQPLAYNGKVYVHSTHALYCFGAAGNSAGAGQGYPAGPLAGVLLATPGAAAVPTQLQIIPSEVLMRPGQVETFEIRGLNADGNLVKKFEQAAWEAFVPPTAKVKAALDATFGSDGKLTAKEGAKQSAGSFKATVQGLSGTIRGRLVPAPPYTQDFEAFNITEDNTFEPGVKFAYPPLPWIGFRFKWEVRELDGNKVLAKTLDNNLFQRAIGFIGQPDMANYTLQADVMTAKHKRSMSVVGVINQRYIISLDGNKQILEIVSNHDLFKASCPFEMKANTWYILRTRVDLSADGSGTIWAKAWEKGSAEPAEWTFGAKHAKANTQGSPGLYGFALQNMARVYIDNVVVTPNGVAKKE